MLGSCCVSAPSVPSVLDAVQLQVVTGAGETLPAHCENMSSSCPSSFVFTWSWALGRQEGGLLLGSSQSLRLFQFCNFSGFCFKAGCLSYITQELWDLININRAHYGKLAIDRSFFKRWNHNNNNDESICVAWILRAAPACSSVFAFHYSYFPPILWKMNFKRG